MVPYLTICQEPEPLSVVCMQIKFPLHTENPRRDLAAGPRRKIKQHKIIVKPNPALQCLTSVAMPLELRKEGACLISFGRDIGLDPPHWMQANAFRSILTTHMMGRASDTAVHPGQQWGSTSQSLWQLTSCTKHGWLNLWPSRCGQTNSH